MGPKANDPPITAEMAKEIFTYDPETGHLIRTKDLAGKGRIGDIAGCTIASGYRKVSIRQHYVMVHRLVWLMVTGSWPRDEIDHRDGNKLNNRFDNLRIANRRQNNTNRSAFAGKALPKGIRHMGGKFQARIRVDKTLLYLGTYSDLADAVAAYESASEKYHGEYARAA